MSKNLSVEGGIQTVSTQWSWGDTWNHVKLRWGIGRMNATIEPKVYAVGEPTPESDVFVSANYTLSFNHLRRALKGINAWILVLDTGGVNVWCAAGKGTFGTSELVLRVNQQNLSTLVTHRRLIVPQLGATGVSAHLVRKRIGFSVTYGPVRANDIKEFVGNGYKATPEMRRVTFPLWERIKLIPVELRYGGYYLIIIPLLFTILSGLSTEGYSFESVRGKGILYLANLAVAHLAGCVITPILLPYIPFRRFSVKGLTIGLLASLLLMQVGTIELKWIDISAWVLIIGSISSFMAMNFTGASTYTSLSGVSKEMKLSLPLQIVGASAGFALWVTSLFT